MPRAGLGCGSSANSMIAHLLEQRSGQQIDATRAWRIETALKPLLRQLELTTLDELITQLVLARTGELSDRVVDALLNQETSFFRDAAVLDMVAEAARELRREAPHKRLRIWSAGCSTGQEPLSLAMLFAERELAHGQLPEIVATDVSTGALARAKAGRYTQFEIQRGLSVRRMMRWFEGQGADWTAAPELLRRVQFRPQNLTTDAPPPGLFDIVLCRNVLLYFSAALRRQVFETLARALRPGGLLVLGAGETVIGQTDQFVPSDMFRGFYQPVRLRDEALRKAG
ncbi:protein-glutamate O-methyltransferase CheR [Sphingomonas sp. HF-S3]|uniref:Protein-glutamate O-methyltransferase CheR n=1 Tax=Sphingomonas rustica TaxID=3103142 RepID=A0ABV0BF79_9SPHN